jgi:hypothetical protein
MLAILTRARVCPRYAHASPRNFVFSVQKSNLSNKVIRGDDFRLFIRCYGLLVFYWGFWVKYEVGEVGGDGPRAYTCACSLRSARPT